jgi:hypothetical protein
MEWMMKMLKLDVETLNVESFPTREVEEERGTVAAHALITYPAPNYTCRYHCTYYPAQCG